MYDVYTAATPATSTPARDKSVHFSRVKGRDQDDAIPALLVLMRCLINDVCFVHFLLQNAPHALVNRI